MEEDISESWEDLCVQYNIDNLGQAEVLVNILDEAKIRSFKLEATFEAEYQHLEFMNQFKLQTEAEEEPSRHPRRGYKSFLKKPEGYPKEYLMELGKEDVRSKIFMTVFEEQIHRIEVQNNYKIFSDRSKIRIYMKEGTDLNMLTRNRLFQMRDQLNILNSWDTGLLMKLSNSAKLREELQKFGVSTWFRWQRNFLSGNFYSTKLNIKQIQKIVMEIGKYDVTLFNFRHRSLNHVQNESIFWLIRQSIADEVGVLQEEYEIDIEFDDKNQCIVVHQKHSCFGREVELSLKRMLNQLLVFSVKSKEIRQFNKRLRKEGKDMPFMQQRMKNSRNETFVCINLDKINVRGKMSSKYLEHFLKLLKCVYVDKQLQLKVFFNHIESRFVKEQIQRVIEVAENNNLILKNGDLSDKDICKGIWNLKDFSEVVLMKRQKQFINFIKDLIVKEAHNPKELDDLVESFFDDDSFHQSSGVAGHMSQIQGQKSRVEEKGQLRWFMEPFSMPKTKEIQEADIPFLLGSRRRDLEKPFEENTRAKLKIFNVQLNAKVDWPAQVEATPVFICNPFVKRNFNEKFVALNPGTMKKGEKGMVVYMDKQLSLKFIPVLHLEKID